MCDTEVIREKGTLYIAVTIVNYLVICRHRMNTVDIVFFTDTNNQYKIENISIVSFFQIILITYSIIH